MLSFKKIILFFTLLLLFLSLQNCKDSKKEQIENIYHTLFTTHKAGSKELYSNQKPWQERIYPLDEIHKDFIIQMNLLDNFKEIPTEYKNFSLILGLIQSIARKEDPIVYRIKEKNILAIYICSNLGGTGISGFVYDGEKVIGGYIIIDGDMIYKKANSWISYKESSVFQSKKDSSLEVTIADSEHNTEEYALNYILLHELGHILSQTLSVLPDQRNKYRNFSEFEFTKKIWYNEDVSVYDDTSFPQRNKILFYSDNSNFEIDSNAEEIYNSLEKTSFPTLYSAINPDDYFADSFVSYISIFIYKQPWKLLIKKKNGEVHTYENGMKSERSKKELVFMRKLLNEN